MKNFLDTSYKTIYLKAGELCIASKPVLVWTVLGSCVSVILINHRKKFVAICHGQLPSKKKAMCTCSDSCPKPCGKAPVAGNDLYVENSVGHMIEILNDFGILPSELEATLYGGANVLKFDQSLFDSIGYLNIVSAKSVLDDYSIRITKEDTGGSTGRTIYFYTDTLEVKVKLHGKSTKKKSQPESKLTRL